MDGPRVSPFLSRLAGGPLLGDGAMGTQRHLHGIPFERCFDQLNLTEPRIVDETTTMTLATPNAFSNWPPAAFHSCMWAPVTGPAEMEAALGVGELQQHREMLRRRQQNAAYLNDRLQDLQDRLQLPRIRKGAEHAIMLYPVVVREGVEREPFLLRLEEAGVETRHLMPLLNQPVYRHLFGDLEPHYPVAARLNRRGFALGCHPGLTGADLDHVSETFRYYFRRA